MDKEPSPIPDDIAEIGDSKLDDVLATLSAPKTISDLGESKTKERKIVTPTSTKRGIPGLEKQLEEHFMAIALTVSAFDPVCGATIAEGSQRLAQSWARLAGENARVKKILENLMQTGAWAEAIIATSTIAYPILRHHDLVPSFTIPSFIPNATNEKSNNGSDSRDS